MVKPLVSALVLSYNHSSFVESCLESLRMQTYSPLQVVIIDDASTDMTPDVIERWLSRYEIDARLKRHALNQGVCRSLNDAIACAEGEYISFMSADDVVSPSKIEDQIGFFRTLPSDYGVVYSDSLVMDRDGARRPGTWLGVKGVGNPPQGDIFEDLLKGGIIPGHTALIRSEVLRSIGGADEGLLHEDWDIWLRLAENCKFGYFPRPLATYRDTSNSLGRTMDSQSSLKNDIAIMSKWLGLRPEWDAILYPQLFFRYYQLRAEGDHIALGSLYRAARSFGLARGGFLWMMALLKVPLGRLTALRSRFSGPRQRRLDE